MFVDSTAGTRARTLAATLERFVLPERVELGTFSKAGGPWTVDWARARRDAQAALAAIDFTRRDVVIWIPGTDNEGVHHDIARSARYVYGGADANELSLTHMPYEASWHLRRSLPTGLATMKLLLEGIRRKLATMPAHARPRILLCGESQGAWIIGEALADPRVGGVVTRAILVGHPWMAKTQYLDGHDPRVRVINHRGDQITMPVGGDVGVGLDAMAAVRTGQLGSKLGTVVRAILANPIHGVLLLHTEARKVGALRPYLRDPHYYAADMPRMLQYLKTGVLDVTHQEADDRTKGRAPLAQLG